MIEFTAYVWCYNEEKRLAITLESLKDFKNVIVIDKSSTDRSVEIARKYKREVFIVDYFDGFDGPEEKKIIKKIWDKCSTDWLFEVTCSDVYHPQLYLEMMSIINSNPKLEVVYVPIYRYSMGCFSKYSYYGDIQWSPKLFKKEAYDWNVNNIHGNHLENVKQYAFLKPDNKKIAVYHLTHEKLELILERHMRYAKVEAMADLSSLSKEDCLKKSWRSILRVVRNYFRFKVYKLKKYGKAQLCMLLMYRCANYLNLFFTEDVEKEIEEKYDKIRKGNYD